jgi:large subunit ribosomal protein L21
MRGLVVKVRDLVFLNVLSRELAMYAVVEDGSKQYILKQGDVVRLDFRQVETGTTEELTNVLLLKNEAEITVGQPLVEGARVLVTVVDHPSVKTSIMKYKRRKNYKRRKGHRQHYTSVRVDSILLPGQASPVKA